VALVRTYVTEEHIVSVIRLTIIGELGTTLAVTSNITFLRCMFWLTVKANVVPNSLIFVLLVMDAIPFLRNVGSYKSHMKQRIRIRHST
jgi:hypothetical protein